MTPPFHFWTGVFFVLGSLVGSFANVCIYRLPRGESVVRPPSHCPACGTQIRWWHNIPLLSWLILGGRCAHCRAPISWRYPAVELLLALAFAGLWALYGKSDVMLVLSLGLFVAGLVVAAWIDLDHLIIPDEITFGGIAAGLVLSVLVPALHGAEYVYPALRSSVLGVLAGLALVYGVLRFGKLLLGRHRLELPAGARIVFTETELVLPGQVIPYDEVFYRRSDALTFHAQHLELVDRCYRNVTVRLLLRAGQLFIGTEKLNPEEVRHMEAATDKVTVPREAMGLGDVKFMAAIGAFIGWPGVLFSLLASSIIGLFVNLALISLGRREWSARIPYGPYIALAATLWVLGGRGWVLSQMAGP